MDARETGQGATAEMQQLIADYVRGTAEVEAALTAIANAELDSRIDGEWSARMVVHHLADSETNSYVRLRRLLAEEPGTLIQGYDEGRWARTPAMGYETADIEESLAVFRAVRAASATVLARLTADDLARHGVHTESGAYTLLDWLRIYAAHALEHAQQMRDAAAGR